MVRKFKYTERVRETLKADELETDLILPKTQFSQLPVTSEEE